ncbi:hypothetical protein INT47_000040 [Mucor saturninus]|uniref:Tc1-like transposase DDE domain-containing protein n=1 Tax=Mucor saturninus TaxID=64648 RepID=A0A8H7RJQ1_9FUNG|nr:hypothetical protein INT47_000040 [Mucor saturninus]
MNEKYNFDSETVPVMIQSYMDWEETAAVNAAQKKAKRKTKPHSKVPFLDVLKKERGSYITKNEAKVVNLINLLQEFGNMSISEASRKVGLSESTAARKLKQEGKGRPAIPKDKHTVFIFELMANEPTLTVEADTDHLSEEFRDIQITPQISEESHEEEVSPNLQARDAVAYWVSQNIGFMNECVFLGEAGFNRSMHRSYGWSEAGTPCKIDVQTKGANVSILGAICKSGLITLSRKEVVLGTRSGKRTRTGDKSQAPKRKGTTNIDLLEYIEQVLTTLDAANMSYKYLVLDNASIHKAALIEDWVGQRGYEDCCK